MKDRGRMVSGTFVNNGGGLYDAQRISSSNPSSTEVRYGSNGKWASGPTSGGTPILELILEDNNNVTMILEDGRKVSGGMLHVM